MRRTAFIVLGWTALTLGCAPAPPPTALALDHPPAVAAQYQTRFQPADGKSPARTVTWRFWREATRVASENLTEHLGQRWQRDGSALFAQLLFHDQRRTLAYQPDDWGVLGLRPSWAEQSLLIDPAILRQLQPRRARSEDGHPVQRFVGVVGSVQWDVRVRTDLVLPLEISKRTKAGWERTVLVEAHEHSAAPWQPPLGTGYPIVDVADLGDADGAAWPAFPALGLH